MATTSECRSCHAKIVWAVTTKGRPIPIDPEPVPDGNIILEPRGTSWRPLPPLATVWTHGAQDGVVLYKSHFATCPAAAKFRKR
jgi:hypothetical protein